ncbi:MAG: alkaline phosphatase family protein [Bacteroidetes bacterium]|nr:alkaline phosphatase family protein [Bacteroidota bacterium]
MTSKKKPYRNNPLLILGWDGAEWSAINHLCEQGYMPHFKAFKERGLPAHIASLQPMISPLLWTSVATGKRAHVHGILGFVENSLEGPQAISNYQRKCPALWNILSEAGLLCQVLNWWPSNPAEEILGDFISNLAFAEGDLAGQCWPPEWQKELEACAAFPESVQDEIIGGFFPNMPDEALADDSLVQKVARIIWRTKHQFEMAMALMDKEADCRFFYFEALDQLQHLGAAYFGYKNSPYHFIIEAAYRWHDAMLGAFLKKAQGHNILLLSDHGFKLDEFRPSDLPDLPAAPALEHEPFGVFVASGPDVQSDKELFGLSLLDIAPSLLNYFRLPIGKDMPGRRQAIFKSSPEPSFIPSWDSLVKPKFLDSGKHQSQGQLQDLEALDYIDLSGTKVQQVIEEEQDYNRAISLKEVGDYKQSLELCDQWLSENAKAYRWYILKSKLLLALADGKKWDIYWKELREDFRKDPHLIFNRALMLIQEGDSAQALALMRDLEGRGIQSPRLFTEIGHALFLAGQERESEVYFKKAIANSPFNSAALNGLAQLSFAQGQMEDFKQWANQALALKMHQPHLHYLWASYYEQEGEIDNAKKALALCLNMAPQHKKAKSLEAKLKGERSQLQGLIVSGFPRSGTSLMMALLAELGIPIISDESRIADHHNPKGYFELETVKHLPAQAKLPATDGKALKVIAPLLPYLPADRNYKVLWMDRPLVEVIISQAKMKGERASLEQFPFQKGQQLEQEKQRLQSWLKQQPHISWMECSYHNLLKYQDSSIIKDLAAFLELDIQEESLKKVVDLQLHRNKIG